MEVQELTLLTPKTFESKIEDLVWEHDCSHFDAVLEFCKDNEIDVEEVTRLLSNTLKQKIKFDAMEEGYVRRDTPKLKL